MPWGKTVGNNRGRPIAHPEEILRAIDEALAKHPHKGEISATALAENVVRYIPVNRVELVRFIHRRMTPEQRAARKISEPKGHVHPVGTLTTNKL